MMWLFPVHHKHVVCALKCHLLLDCTTARPCASSCSPRLRGHTSMWVISGPPSSRASLSSQREKALTSAKLSPQNQLGRHQGLARGGWKSPF